MIHKEMTQTLRLHKKIYTQNKHVKGLAWIIHKVLGRTAMRYYFASFILIESSNTKDALEWPYFYIADGNKLL